MGLSNSTSNFDGASAHSALQQLVSCIYDWRNNLSGIITNLEVGPDDDFYTDKCYDFVYQDVACCNAAIGSIAPCLEGLFLHEFPLLRVQFGNAAKPNSYHRWKLDPDKFWVPSAISNKGELGEKPDFVRGVNQLVRSLAIGSYFPGEMEKTLAAIFRYRNFALHQGYEWAPDSRTKFMELVNDEGWDTWFSTEDFCGDVWVVYATDALIRDGVEMFSKLLESFREIHQKWKPEQNAN